MWLNDLPFPTLYKASSNKESKLKKLCVTAALGRAKGTILGSSRIILVGKRWGRRK